MNPRQKSENKLEEIRNLEKNIKAAISAIASNTEHEDVAIFIGSTKSGKSTLINYLINNELLGVKDTKLRTVGIQKADRYQHGPEIGRGPTSETVIPTRWASPRKLPDLALWDSPGLEDNRSSSQDIINAFYIYELFKNIRTAKVVLVTDFNDIFNDRINSFLSLLTSVDNLFNGNFDCFRSIVVIFTKVPNEIDDEPINVDFVTDIVEHKILKETSLEISQWALEFVRYLIKHDEQIGLFRRASVGPITSNIDTGVVHAIRTARSIGCRILNTVSPSISHKSKVFLHEIHHDLISSGPLEGLGSIVAEILMDRLDDLQNEMRSINFSRPSKRHMNNLCTIEDQLDHLQRYIKKLSKTDTDFCKILRILHKIHPYLLAHDISIDDLVDGKNMMAFIDSLLDQDNTKLILRHFRSKMTTVESNASEVMLNLQISKEAIEKDINRRRIEKERKEREEEEKEERRKREEEEEEERREREEEERERRKKERELQKKRESRRDQSDDDSFSILTVFNPGPIIPDFRGGCFNIPRERFPFF